MSKITAEMLRKTDREEWRDFYLENGEDMLALAHTLLGSKKDEDVDLGLSIIEGGYFEEDKENPEAIPSLSKLDFRRFDEPLERLAKKEAYKKRVKKVQKIVKLENPTAEPLSANKLSDKLKNAIRDIGAPSETKARKAAEALISLAGDGVDILEALPTIFDQEEKLARSTDAVQAVVLFYIRSGQFKELEDRLKNPDEGIAVRTYRAVTGLLGQEIDIKAFLDRPDALPLLKEISEKYQGEVLSIDEFLS